MEFEVSGEPEKDTLPLLESAAEEEEESGCGAEDDMLAHWRPSGAGSVLRPRAFLSDAQVKTLADQFRRNPLPSKYELSALAERIGVNKRVVQVMQDQPDHFRKLISLITFPLRYGSKTCEQRRSARVG